MSKPNRWMPLDWGDYWRDTGHLNAAEHGAYLNLLGAYWVSGQALPDDDVRLGRLARTTSAEWRRVRDVLRAFFTVRDGLLHHKRVEREIARATDVHSARVDRIGKINARRKQTSPTTSSPTSSPISSPPSPSPSPPHQDSVPHGTGADAPLSVGEGAPIQGSLKSRIFGPCLTWLAAQSKLPEARARTITARWCAKFGDGPVLEAFTAAARQAPLDPVPYIEKVLTNAAHTASNTATTTGPAASAFRNASGQPRAVRDAHASAVDHLAGLRDALGLGSVEAVPQPTAIAEREQPGSNDRGPDSGTFTGG